MLILYLLESHDFIFWKLYFNMEDKESIFITQFYCVLLMFGKVGLFVIFYEYLFLLLDL